MPVLSPRLKLPVPNGAGDGSDVPHWFDLWKSILDDAALFTQGTLLQRPVSTVPAPGIRGRFHYVTGDGTAVNNGILWLDTGTGWVIASTTGWYKSSATAVKTDSDLQSAATVGAMVGTVNNVVLGWNGTANAPAIAFGLANDTNLYRSAAGKLATDGTFLAVGGLASGAATGNSDFANAGVWAAAAGQVSARRAANAAVWRSSVVGDTGDRFTFDTAGLMQWGPSPGTGVFDTNLYRSSTDVLRTDDSLVVALDIYARGGAATQVASGDISILGVGGAARAGVVFGSAADTNLYRSTADTLKTDDNLIVALNLTVSGTVNGRKVLAQPYFRAYKSADTGPIATGSVVVFDTETDPNGWYNNANGRFQPTQAGRYRVSWSMGAQPLGADDRAIGSFLRLNGAGASISYGSTAYQRATAGSNRHLTSHGTDTVSLNGTTDFLEVIDNHDGDFSMTIEGSVGRTHFEAEYIGA